MAAAPKQFPSKPTRNTAKALQNPPQITPFSFNVPYDK